jgi:hypothetical protein
MAIARLVAFNASDMLHEAFTVRLGLFIDAGR